MFQFPGLPPRALCVQARVAGIDPRRVFPFGDPRVTGRVPLTVDYRSLPRPSSASSAKASTACPFHLLTSMVRCHTYLIAIRCDLRLIRKISLALCGSQGTSGARALGTGRCGFPGCETVLVAEPTGRPRNRCCCFLGEVILPRKEVIQPHVPVRLPCYDFTPLTLHTFGASPLAVGPATSGADDSGGVTGGVYKARERIHRGVLIRDY